ncbi:hypothetical protein DP939_27755 [Spongiactinospora rosea]|uniref:Uncharacterized protein n=1 Tax=Spongiactinospora rosea TaxID=2248750 RepID=A0A366LSC5_9ACTN|nr:hypothetical protein [Spongiactinospora rosea]RBQ16865.1 hypothetical protein DP939_27755 [Spongiactinospora rosea]
MEVASFGGKIYLGAYPRARIYEYDPSREWRLGVNPKEVWNGDAVSGDRPFAMAAAGDRLAIGTVKKSGYLGGRLLFHNPRTGRTEVHDKLVKDQSIMSLAYRNGVLYAGTSVYGGYGAAETQTDARLIAWDVKKGRELWEKTPVPGERTVSSLSFDRQGRLWGATAGVVFRYDDDGRFTSRRYTPYNWPQDGGYALADLAFRKRDGQLYGSMPGVGLYRLDPRTWKMTVITDARSIGWPCTQTGGCSPTTAPNCSATHPPAEPAHPAHRRLPRPPGAGARWRAGSFPAEAYITTHRV